MQSQVGGAGHERLLAFQCSLGRQVDLVVCRADHAGPEISTQQNTY